MRLECEIWLSDGERAFDQGCVRILEAIQRNGSLRSAVAELKMSYSWAWQILNATELKLGFPLLSRSIGGGKGGGCVLTPEGHELMERYLAARAEVEVLMGEVFDRHFPACRGDTEHFGAPACAGRPGCLLESGSTEPSRGAAPRPYRRRGPGRPSG